MESDKFKNDLLRQINKYRKDHGSKPLTNDTKIDRISQKFAEDLAKKGKLDYSYNQYKGEDLGETVYKSESYIAPLKLAKYLYDEISEYDFKTKNPEPSNFSQMVWKSSETFGFGMKQNSKGIYFYVLNYFPSGNVDGEFKSNVSPVGSSTSKTTTSKITTNNKTSKKKDDDDDFDDDNFGKFSNFGSPFAKKNKKVTAKDNGYEVKYEYEFTTAPKKGEKKYEYEYIEDQPVEYVFETKKKVEYNKTRHNRTNSTTTAGKIDLHKFCLEALETHNQLRKIHHVGPLKLNDEINQIAQKYSEKLAEINRLEHSENEYKDEPLGENLYFCGGMETTGDSIVRSWYNEHKIHRYDGDFMSGTGHFTQLIWKDTKEFGIGIARSRTGNIYCVANYYPAGNVIGFFKKNVFRP